VLLVQVLLILLLYISNGSATGAFLVLKYTQPLNQEFVLMLGEESSTSLASCSIATPGFISIVGIDSSISANIRASSCC